jgi:uncharacterized membrane protein
MTPIFPPAPIIATIIAQVACSATRDRCLQTHLRWQRRTFWFGLLWFAIGSLTVQLLIGLAIWGIAAVWFTYRVASGWFRLTQQLPMYQDRLAGRAAGQPESL